MTELDFLLGLPQTFKALCWFNFGSTPLEVYSNTSQPADLFAFVHTDKTSEIHGCIKSDFILRSQRAELPLLPVTAAHSLNSHNSLASPLSRKLLQSFQQLHPLIINTHTHTRYIRKTESTGETGKVH